jgi:16S rRNA (guanine966-N2)-methyltransferase
MRIIAGTLGGRTFDAPKGHRTHPMSELVRGALFNALGELNNLSILDAYAGSGAISFEAVSRGAKHVTAIEVDKTAYQTIVHNIESLGLGLQIKATRANIAGWLQHNAGARFDVIICDPPYDNVESLVLVQLSSHLNNGGLFVCSLPPAASLILPGTFHKLSQKSYGDAALHFYRRS